MSTLLTVKTLARQRADLENSMFVGDSEMTTYVNRAVAELYETLVNTYEDYYLTSSDFTLAGGVGGNTYTLPGTFYKLRGLDKDPDTTQRNAIRAFTWQERNRMGSGPRYKLMGTLLELFPAEYAAGNYRLWWIPQPTALVNDSDTLDSTMEPFLDFLAWSAAIPCLDKGEEDSSTARADKAAAMARVLASSTRDAEPQQCSDIRPMLTSDLLLR